MEEGKRGKKDGGHLLIYMDAHQIVTLHQIVYVKFIM